jgi:hypothetical protein
MELKSGIKEDRSLEEGDRVIHGLKCGQISIQGGRGYKKSLVLKVLQYVTVRFHDI